jgi:2-isopropylmalate synthase
VLSVDGHQRTSFSEGDGPVDAVFRAIEQEAASGAKLLLFSINAITTGTDSQAEVMVRLERDGRIVNGAGADTDIIVASAKSYLDALNTLGAAPREHPQISVI